LFMKKSENIKIGIIFFKGMDLNILIVLRL
jgi:hypothetical protein